MPRIKTAMGRRLVRWMLAHEQPSPLAIEHPVQEDLSAAADEIERLSAAIQEIKAEYHKGASAAELFHIACDAQSNSVQ